MATSRRKSSRQSRKRKSGESRSRTASTVSRKAGSAPRTPFALQDGVVESALTTGELSPLLEEYFGAPQYAELRQLAREASTRAVRGGPRVLILPGIMGSKIGRDSKIPLFDDVLWVDPIDVAAGRLMDIALPRGRDLRPLGVILLAYLKLKLQLRAAGMNADFHPFDWRRSIPELGRELKAKLDGLGKDVFLVAHSMGGLVSRSAIAQGASYKRLIMLGTPNFGSFAPVMALRATYPVVRKIGWLDTKHTAEQLCRDVFASFPGLTQMLPFRDRWDGLDFFDLANWPGTEGLAPRKEILDATPAVQKSLAPGRDSFFLIAGVDQSTPVSATLETKDGKAEFVFEFSQEGDGTVPLEFCRLPDIGGTWYVKEGHGGLPNNGTVGRAVIDIIEKGTTAALPQEWLPADRRAVRRASETQLRAIEPYAGRRSGLLSQGETRLLLEEVASPVSSEPAAAVAGPAVPPTGAPPIGPGYQHAFEQVVVGRRRQHRIELRFALGSITEADARAIALGAFSDVTPSGAASALDARVGGAITELFRRRMFSARIGEVFVLPRGRHALAAEFITFVGLGSFDRFNDQALQTAAENVIRTFINARIEEFATVLFGGGSGESPAGALQNLLTGFFRGLKDADHDHRFRRITVCEQNPERYTTLKAELFRLSSTSLGEDVEMTFDEQVLPEAPDVAAPAARRVRREDPVYLIVRQERSSRGKIDVRSSLLTAGSKATIITGVATAATEALEAVRDRIVDGPGSGFAAAGVDLGKLVLPEDIRVVLPRFSDRHLVVVHDAPMSRVPWEVLAFPAARGGDVWFPSIRNGLTHRYAAENLSVAKWLEERVQDGVLNLLLVVNPTLDLAGAEKEGKRIRQLFAGQPGVKLRELHGSDATHRTLLAAFSSGEYDVIHYAGHAFFDEDSPEQSGLLCNQHVPLTGSQLSALGRLPALVFFNACEAGRVRGARSKPSKRKPSQAPLRKLQRAVGFAEAFMRGGVANFLGTYWEVGDDAALEFAQAFYRDLVAGRTLGESLQSGRTAVRAVDDRDWADYLFYGSPDFVLKEAR